MNALECRTLTTIRTPECVYLTMYICLFNIGSIEPHTLHLNRQKLGVGVMTLSLSRLNGGISNLNWFVYLADWFVLLVQSSFCYLIWSCQLSSQLLYQCSASHVFILLCVLPIYFAVSCLILCDWCMVELIFNN